MLLWRFLVLILACGVIGCGGKKEPEDFIKISMVSTGDPGQRDVLMVPDLDGASVEVWEYKEPVDLRTVKRDAKPVPPTRTARVTKADWAALWKSFPKGAVWKLTDQKGGAASAPVYTVEFKNNGRHVKAVIEGPEQAADKSAWQVIEPCLKLAGVK